LMTCEQDANEQDIRGRHAPEGLERGTAA